MMMLMANGHSPAPKISPCWVLLMLNSAPQVSISIARTWNPKAVAISAAKQPQNSSMF